MNACKLTEKLNNDEFTEQLMLLYGTDEQVLALQKQRYIKAIRAFMQLFPGREDIHLFSAPGRSEIGGNHTDHQHGCALAAAVDLDVIAVVAFHNDGVIRVQSEGHRRNVIDLSDLSVHEDERERSNALIRGIAAGFAERGVAVSGFDAYTVSDVFSGSGLSSSAAFETLIGTVIDTHDNGGNAGEIEIAKTGHCAENVYYGKGSGLLDQLVCSVGGFVFIDFNDTAAPVVKKYRFDFEEAGYRLCITDTKGSHSDLTGEYAAVPAEMKSVAAYFGKRVLREVDEKAFYEALPDLRGKCSDRAILRAMHFFGENKRAIQEADALERGDLERFFALYRQSAASSETLLQNLYATSDPTEQAIPLALAVSRLVLGDDGAARVHGGGFAGTVQAFVPAEKTEEYVKAMDAMFGDGSCRAVRVRPVGGFQLI